MQAKFNPFNAQQREHEVMIIRHLEDDDDGDDDDEDVNTKKHMLPLKIAKKKKDSKHQHCKAIDYKLWKAEEICNIRDIFHAENNSWYSKVSSELLAKERSS